MDRSGSQAPQRHTYESDAMAIGATNASMSAGRAPQSGCGIESFHL